MKIILTTPYFFPQGYGGGQTYVYRIAKELQRLGHSIVIVTPVKWEGGNAEYVTGEYEYDSLRVISFSINPQKQSYIEKELDFGPVIMSALKEIVNEFSPDLIHINGTKAAWVRVCNDLNMPHVVTAHHTGLVCSAGAMLLPDGSVCNKEINFINCVPCANWQRRPRWFAGGIINLMPAFMYRIVGSILSRRKKLSYIERGLITPWLIEQGIKLKRSVLEDCHCIIAPSRYMLGLLSANGSGEGKLILLPHAVDPLKVPPIKGLEARSVSFGYIGRIDRAKGLHILLEAAATLKWADECEIHIFGNAASADAAEYKDRAIAAYTGKARLIDHGYISSEKIAEAYAAIDVVVAPSLLPEAFGLVVLEAFSAGRPVIVFRSGALAESVSGGINGFVLRCGDIQGLTKIMQRMINAPLMIMGMVENIEKVKTSAEYTAEIVTVYEDIISRNRR